jgi:HK97 family phage portal protein
MSIFSNFFGTKSEPQSIPELENYQPPVFDNPYPHTPEKSFEEKAETKSWSVSSGSSNMGFALGFAPSNTGVAVTEYTALGSNTFYAGVNAVSNDIAKLPFNLYRSLPDGGSERIRKHNILKVLKNPCPWVNSYDFWLNLVFNKLLYGNSYVWIDRDKAGQPRQLVPVRHTSCFPQIIPNYGLIYNFNNSFIGQHNDVDFEDMIHLRGVSIDDGIYGARPVWINQGVISLDLAVTKHAATMFRQGTILTGTLNTPMVLQEETARRTRKSWTEANTGSDNAHKVAILEDGLTFTPIGQTAANSQLTEARKLCAIEIARILGVPQHRVGIMDNASFSNIESQQLSYIDQTLGSICRQIEIEFNRKLLFEEEQDDYYFKFDFDELLRTDTKTRFEAHAIGLQNGFLNPNEVREIEDLNPRSDGDAFTPMMNLQSPTQSGAPKPNPASDDLGMTNPPKPKKGHKDV